MSSLRLWCVLTVAFLLGLPEIAHADRDKAKAHYQRGTSYYNLSRFGDALKEYEAAYLEYPDPVFLFNIGQCYRQLGQAEMAIKSYRNYLRNAENPPNRRDVEERIRELEAGLAQSNLSTMVAPPAPQKPTSADSEPVAPPPVPVVAEAAMPPVAEPALGHRAQPEAGKSDDDGVPAWLVWGGIGVGVLVTVVAVLLISSSGTDRPACPEGIRCF